MYDLISVSRSLSVLASVVIMSSETSVRDIESVTPRPNLGLVMSSERMIEVDSCSLDR
jgi:hypothetical protein